jgi:hypothetical protein
VAQLSWNSINAIIGKTVTRVQTRICLGCIRICRHLWTRPASMHGQIWLSTLAEMAAFGFRSSDFFYDLGTPFTVGVMRRSEIAVVKLLIWGRKQLVMRLHDDPSSFCLIFIMSKWSVMCLIHNLWIQNAFPAWIHGLWLPQVRYL